MKKYDYLESIKEDVREYIREHDIKCTTNNRKEVQEKLNDDCFISDSVTGNASGSYTFNVWKAEEYLCHNMELLQEACCVFGCEPDLYSPERCDVIIRCYLLDQAINDVLDEIEEE